jgi:general secretion pathway protein C
LLSRVKALASAENSDQFESWLRLTIIVVATIMLLVAMVNLTWALLVADDDNTAPPMTVINGSSSAVGDSQVDINRLQELDFFGENIAINEASIKKVETTTATVTKLNLELNGVILSSMPELSVAIISYQKKQKNYQTGASLPGGGRVKLLEVFSDRVLIENSGRTESLLLFDKNSKTATITKPPKVQPGKRTDDRRNNADTQNVLTDMRNRFQKNPSSLMKIINARPYSQEGQLIGYRVAPGREAEAFQQLGFENGDVITAVNGEAITDPSKLMTLYKMAGEAQQVNLSVLRQGQSIDLLVGFDTE